MMSTVGLMTLRMFRNFKLAGMFRRGPSNLLFVLFFMAASSLVAGPIAWKVPPQPIPPEPAPAKKISTKDKDKKTVSTTKTDKSAAVTDKTALKDKVVSKEKPADKPVASKNYRLSPNDFVEVEVYQEPDLDTKTRVNEDGTISLPLVGPVKVGGLNALDAAKLITQKLSEDYLVNPQVTVNVTEFSKRQFVVMGSVKQPGVYGLPGNQSIDVLQAIASAGGSTNSPDMRHVTVQRRISGKEKLYRIDAKEMQSGGAEPFEVQAGDTITIGESVF